MAFGLEIFTSKGFVDFSTSAPARLIHVEQIRSTSGSVVVPDFDDTEGFIFIQNNHYYYWMLEFSWDNSTKTFTWSPAPVANQNDNFDIYFFLED